MSINNQKKILFVPIINILPLLFWVKMCFNKPIKVSYFIKEYFKLAVSVIGITAIRLFLIAFLPEIGQHFITAMIFIYFYFTTIAYLSIRAQIKIESN